MKRIIVAILLSTLLLTGCGSNEPEEIMNGQFVVIEKEVNTLGCSTYKIYDKDTKVIYFYFDDCHQAGITPLYNADGTLRIYEEDKQYDSRRIKERT